MKIKKYSEFNFKIPKEIRELSDVFEKNGKRLYIVGGYCRDILMGLSPIDIDLATDSLPDETISFLNGKYKVDLVGKAFGVIIVSFGSMKIEIASFRSDMSLGRHPDVKLGVSIEEDVKRRDITISSLFFDIQENKIVDLVGGIKDIERRIIKMVGDPKERLMEDQLRSLRCIRFACRYNFSFDKTTEEDLKIYSDLSGISPERIWEEFKKAFEQSKDFNRYLSYITEFNMWSEVFTQSNINTILIESIDFIVVVANLFKNEPINDKVKESLFINKMVQNYKIEIETASKVVFLLLLLNFKIDNVLDFYKKKQQCSISDNTILEWIKIENINNTILYSFLNYKPSVSAEDLMKKGFKGAALGAEIKRLEVEKFKQMI